MKKSDLPFGSEFSPNQVNLPGVLELAKQNEGDKSKFEDTLKSAFFINNRTSERNKSKLAMNLRLSMKAYGIIDKDVNLTDFGNYLFNIRNDTEALYRALSKHILLNLKGLILIQCIKDMEAAGEKIDLVTLRHWLEERGIHFPRGGKHPSMMRLWLEKAGVFSSKWHINEIKLKEIAGLSTGELDALTQLSPEQRAFLKAFVNMGGIEPRYSNNIEKLAAATFGIKFNEKMLAKMVLYPLRDAGYISLERGTKLPGRGAKPFIVTPTERLNEEIIIPVFKQVEQQVEADLRPLLRQPINEIIRNLKEESKHIRGLALEALAFKLMRIIDLDYVATRLRGNATGGAEVDLIFESTRLVYSRWQVQCKNTTSVSLDDVAKEVGLTHFLKSNVIIIVSTGKIGPAARNYANKVMSDSNLAIAMIDHTDIKAIVENPSFIIDVLTAEAKHAMKLKKIEI
jgi:site-specific DNA-methyltransferase (cytosine-N4-specific)